MPAVRARYRANRLIAFSALLLFQGTLSKSRNVKSFDWFLRSRSRTAHATSERGAAEETA